MKAARNKTIDFSVEEGKDYLKRCITLKQGYTDKVLWERNTALLRKEKETKGGK